MGCCLLSEPKIRRYRKRILNLWLQEGMFWVSKQRLVDQANIFSRNSQMIELEIEELERQVTGSACRRRPEKCFAGNGSTRAG